MNYLPMRAMLLWLFAPIVWAAHFFLLYGVTTAVCTSADISRPEQIRWIAVALTALALALLMGFGAWQFHAGGEDRSGRGTELSSFLRTTAMALVALAVIGVLWNAAGGILLPTCATAAE